MQSLSFEAKRQIKLLRVCNWWLWYICIIHLIWFEVRLEEFVSVAEWVLVLKYPLLKYFISQGNAFKN